MEWKATSEEKSQQYRATMRHTKVIRIISKWLKFWDSSEFVTCLWADQNINALNQQIIVSQLFRNNWIEIYAKLCLHQCRVKSIQYVTWLLLINYKNQRNWKNFNWTTCDENSYQGLSNTYIYGLHTKMQVSE